MGYGKNLKMVLKEKGISVKQLGRLLGISPSTMYSCIRRDSGLRLDHALPVAEYLDISPDLICGQYSFGKDQGSKERIDNLYSEIRSERRKDIIKKQVDTLMGFDKGHFAAADKFIELLQGKSLRETEWILSLLDVASRYPDGVSIEEVETVNNANSEN